MTSRAASCRRVGIVERFAQALPRTGPLAGLRHHVRGAYGRILGGRNGVLTARLPGGESVRIDPAWRHITWNLDEYAALRAAVRPGDVVIDAGANVGCYAVLLGGWVGDSGRVFAFEPDPRAFAGLVRHIELNGLAGRVVPIQAALAERSAIRRLHLSDASGVSRLVEPGRGNAGVEVRALAVDEFCAAEGIMPALIKVDVEGAELSVLRGASRTLLTAPDVVLFIELHPSIWPSLGFDAPVLRRELSSLGFALDEPDTDRDPWRVEGVCLRFTRRR